METHSWLYPLLMKLASGLSGNMYLEKIITFPSRLATWYRDLFKISCCNLLWFPLWERTSVYTLYVKRYSSVYEIIQNFNVCSYRTSMELGLLRSGSVHGLNLLYSSFTYIQTNMHLKHKFCLIHTSYIQMHTRL